MISLKKKLREKELSVGCWITLAHPAIAEIMAQSGFDWLAVDLEHSVITIREAEELIRTIALMQKVPLVRLSANDPVQIKRVMDAGSHGVIVPMVNSKSDAQKAVDSVYYPTAGKRGVGLARAQKYGTGFDPYREWLDREAVIIAQIEHVQAVENLREILSVKNIDGYIVGPYDLSASMGLPGKFDHPKVVEALKEIERVASEMRVPGGVHIIQPRPEELKQRVAEGFKFIAYSLDFLLLGDNCRRGLEILK